MTNPTPQLSEETRIRINKDVYDFGQLRLETGYSTTITGQKEAYLKGAKREAERALKLVEALSQIENNYGDHDFVRTLIVETLQQYNNPLP